MNISALNSQYNLSFGTTNSKTPYVDAFITELKKKEKQEQRGGFFSRNLSTTTGSIPFGCVILYEIYAIIKLMKMRKIIPKPEFKKLSKKLERNIFVSLGLAVLASIGINKYLDTKTDENYIKLNQKFNKLNKNTNAVLSDKFYCSMYKGAAYNPISGIIQLNKNIINDPIDVRKTDKIIRHELVHAKQYELVARSKDGIRKINYATVNTITKNVKKNPLAKSGFKYIYKDLQNSGDKYKNVKVRLDGGSAEVDLNKYVTAINIMLNNPKAGINDIPIIIDAKHYQNVIDKKGPLSPEEEKKADMYYNAMLNYSEVDIFSAWNPFSSYRQNLLEKEAYKQK